MKVFKQPADVDLVRLGNQVKGRIEEGLLKEGTQS